MALYVHPSNADGLQYRSRHDPQRVCFVLYDRAQERIEVEQLGPLDERALRADLIEVLDVYKIGLL